MKTVNLLVTIETSDDTIEAYDVYVTSPIKNSSAGNRAAAHVMDIRILPSDFAEWVKKEVSNVRRAA